MVDLREGDIVHHPEYGVGRVLAVYDRLGDVHVLFTGKRGKIFKIGDKNLTLVNGEE
jgi:hypothetical protein